MKNKILGALLLIGASFFSFANANTNAVCDEPLRLLDNGVTIVAADCTVGGQTYNFQEKEYYVASDVNDLRNKIKSGFPANQIVTTKLTSLDNFGATIFTFNEPIDSWDVSNVTSMRQAFSNLYDFNQDISKWNVSNVTNMDFLFNEARSFNQDISDWNVEKVTNMFQIFSNSHSFNKDISKWNPVSLVDGRNAFLGRNSFSKENYDKLLNSWAEKKLKTGVTFGPNTLSYCAGKQGRKKLIAKGWTISGDREDCDKRSPVIQVPDGVLLPDDEKIVFAIFYGTDNVAVEKYTYVIRECDRSLNNCTKVVSETDIPHLEGKDQEIIEYTNLKKDELLYKR